MDQSNVIPSRGLDREELLATMEQMRSEDPNWRSARTWSMVYHAGDAHYEFLKKAHNLFFSANGLNPMAFQSLKRMEAEAVRMTANMLHGDANVVGTITSGGTESLLMAVKAARDRAKSGFRLPTGTPEIVAPRTIHVAVNKAAHYFGLKVRHVPVDANYQVDVRAYEKAINRNTVLLIASAPQYAHGMIDPIDELGEIALRAGLPLHIDACFGGFFLPWMERLGYQIPRWDFRVPGVTSISADVHKFGYAAKGASFVLYRDMSYLRHQFFVETNWPGGIYASPSMAGTRPGGPIAAAWASMKALGEDGYLELARRTMEAVEALKAGVAAIPGLAVLGSAHGPIVCIGAAPAPRSEASHGARALDIYAVADLLQKNGWHIDRQQFPASLHLTVTQNHLEHVPAFLEDLRAAVEYLEAHPEVASEGQAAMYGMMAKIPLRGAVKLSVLKVMESMHGPAAASGKGGAPDLGSLGKGDDASPLFKAIDRYGGKAMEVLDRIEDTKQNVRGVLEKLGLR